MTRGNERKTQGPKLLIIRKREASMKRTHGLDWSGRLPWMCWSQDTRLVAKEKDASVNGSGMFKSKLNTTSELQSFVQFMSIVLS